MPVVVRVDVLNLAQATDFIHAIERRLDDPGVIGEGLGRAMVDLVDLYKDNFDSEGRVQGRRWAPLAEATLQERALKGYGSGPILQRDRALYRAATFQNQPLRRGNAANYHDTYSGEPVSNRISYSRDSVTIMLEGEKVANHFGSPQHNLPARPIWFLSSRTDRVIRDSVSKWIEDQIITEKSIQNYRYGRP